MKPVSIEDYLKRSGDPILEQDESLADPEHGFLTWRVKGDVLFAISMYGDGKHWNNELDKIAKHYGCKTIRCGTRRNPKAFARLFGCKITGYIMEREVR